MPSPSVRVALVTGASSGIGQAVARLLVQREWRVVGVSRRPGTVESPRYAHVRVDLADLAGLAERIEAEVGPLVAGKAAKRLALVNSAADPAILGPIGRIDPVAMLAAYAVNVAAPTWLMGWILRQAGSGVALRIVNVSSGAAVGGFPGLGAYGSSKAALRMAGMVLAAELDAAERGEAAILSYDPGPVDTAMQATVRASSVETLPIVGIFQEWAAEGRLAPPEGPAADIADYLEGDGHPRFAEQRFGAGP